MLRSVRPTHAESLKNVTSFVLKIPPLGIYPKETMDPQKKELYGGLSELTVQGEELRARGTGGEPQRWQAVHGGQQSREEAAVPVA